MPRPSRYFYNMASSDITYSSIPTNMLSVDRLLSNKPCWQNFSAAVIFKKKTLILNAPELIVNGTTNFKRVANERLHALQKEGFDLYIYRNEGFYRFRHLAFTLEMKLSDETLKIAAIQNLKLTHDEVLILNAYELKELIEGDDDDWRFLPSFQTVNLSQSNISGRSLKRFITEKGSEIETLNLSGCVNLQDASFDQGLELKQFRALVLSNTHDSRTSNIPVTAIEQLIIAGKTTLEFLELDLTYCQESHDHLLQSFTDDNSLNSLTLVGFVSSSEEPLTQVDFHSLETLSLSDSEISPANFRAILKQARNLKHLKLKGMEGFTEVLSEELNLSLLETLEISGSNICFPEIDKILSEAQGLKTLKLRGCYNLTSHLKRNYKLNFLEILDLSSSDICFERLSTILTDNKTLKSLTLNGCPALTDNIPEAFDFACLEELSLSESPVSSTNLNQFLIQIRSLHCLNLKGCVYLNEELAEAACLTSLKTLDLSASNITPTALGNILKQAQQLKILHLDNYDLNYDNSEEPEEPEEPEDHDHKLELAKSLLFYLNFQSIEVLTLSSTWFTKGDWYLIFQRASSIKELDLSHHGTPQIDIRKADALRSLEKLTMVNSELLICDIASELGFSDHFKELHANIVDISDEDIDDLQIASPNLSIIYDNLSESDTLSDKKKNNERKPLFFLRQIIEEALLDADTLPNPDKKFSVERIFYPGSGAPQPNESLYRLQAFNAIGVNSRPCSIKRAFLLKNNSLDLQLAPCSIPSVATDLFSHLNQLPKFPSEYYAKQTIQLSFDWQPLPSLSVHDKMTKYHLSQNTAVDIHYSMRDNMYYIRSTPSSTLPRAAVEIDFIIEISEATHAIALPKDISHQIEFYKKFKGKSLNITTQTPDGMGYMNALLQQKVGACRHRTFLFKAWMQKSHPEIPVRIVNNDCHSFVELYYDGQWQTYNLGGYSAKLEIKEPYRPSCHTEAEPQEIELTEEGITPPRTTLRYFPLEQQEHAPCDTTEYIHRLLSTTSSSCLIKAQNSDVIAGLRYHLQKQCKSLSRPYFYIHSPDDLICLTPHIELREANIGILKKGPGGPLHAFLTTHTHDQTKPLLIVNYDQFSANDIVRFNALLDTDRKADGTPLPSDMQVFGLINPDKPEAYNGADFYSRFDEIIACSLSESQLDIPPITQLECLSYPDEVRIELYDGATWEEELLGRWSLNGESLFFNEGPLIRALQQGARHFNLSNAPWHDPSFQCFWQTALLNQCVEIKGITTPLPEEFSLRKSKGYAFEHAKEIIRTDVDTRSLPMYVLNQRLMTRLLGQYRCEEGSIYPEQGLIEANAGGALSVCLSHALSDAAWLRILEACQTHHVKLNLSLPYDLSLPKGFHLQPQRIQSPFLSEHWSADIESQTKTAYVSSTDIDVSVKLMSTNYEMIIDITEVDPADLLTKISSRFDDELLRFQLEEEPGVLIKALQENQNVILKGLFNEEMQQALADLLYQRQHDTTLRSKLILISSEPNLFPFVPSYIHAITLEEKIRALPEDQPFTDELINTKSLAELNAIYGYPGLKKCIDSNLPWIGMETLPIETARASRNINLCDAESISNAFNAERMNAVEQALLNAPFVFLAGMSGVGKTSFVKNIWTHKHKPLYVGQDHIMAWAKDRSLGIKTLFIDEANISSRQWSEFEGLFNTSPAILVGNEYITLTTSHKVIFAGNPLSYGGERHMPSFFKRHGNSIVFKPMPPEFIYHEILKHAFFGTDQEQLDEIALPILKVADYLTSCSQSNVLITPRELTTMMLFTQCHDSRSSRPVDMEIEADFEELLADIVDNPFSEDPVVQCDADSDVMNQDDHAFEDLLSEMVRHPLTENPVAQYYAYILARHLVPEPFKTDFEKTFKVLCPSRRPLPKLTDADFISTESNQLAREALEDFLSIRNLRQTQLGNPTQQYGGLGGLILEGEPGIGKTELVIKTLTAHGLRKANWHSENTPSVFYIIPVSTTLPQKKELLLKAFHEGAMVVIDEINSAPMMEELLNNLLMGQTPDGKPPKQPGFLVIGTQNPVTMAGRMKASTALQRRMLTVFIPNYSPEEMIKILQHKGLGYEIAQNMVDEYLSLRQGTEKGKLCFRDLLKRAKIELQSKRTKEASLGLEDDALDAVSKKRTLSGTHFEQSILSLHHQSLYSRAPDRKRAADMVDNDAMSKPRKK